MPKSEHNPERLFASASYISLIVLTSSWLLAAFVSTPRSNADQLTDLLFRHQDQWVAPIFLAACLIGPVLGPSRWALKDNRLVPVCMLAALIICWLGHYLIFQGIDLSRDEQMVTFDAAIFQSGTLIMPIADEWRPFAGSLHRTFVMVIGENEAWVSAYLPVNAMLHATVGLVADVDLTAPLLVSAGGYLLWRIAREIWTDSTSTRAVAIVLYFASSQVIVTGMTKFSMSAHLTLNLLWLLLFLRNTGRSHAVAIAVGFFAVGLHQPVFHPLFILPFLDLLRQRKQWKLLGAYIGAYGLIVLFWFAWPLILAGQTSGVEATTVGASANFITRLQEALKPVEAHGAWLMGANVTRLLVWQHPLLLPLASFGVLVAWRADPFVRALILSVLLPISFFWLVLPWQGYGWGYRYLHPALGSLFLLAASGWHQLEEHFDRNLHRQFVWTTAVAVSILLPTHAWMARHIAEPLALTDRQIDRLPAEIAIIDDSILDDLAHNAPDLANRPLRLLSGGVAASQISDLCSRGRVIFVDPPSASTPSSHQFALKRRAVTSNCETAQVKADRLAHNPVAP